jgi:chemotaxis protein CheD
MPERPELAEAPQASPSADVRAAPTQLVVVPMAGLEVTADPRHVLVTYALGSCIAIIVHDAKRRLGGMIHFMLPSSSMSPDKAREKPAMFGDTGVPLLFESMYALGTTKRDLTVKVVGGAQICDDHGVFDIGRRNHLIVRQMFWKVGVVIAAEEVGGDGSRTARLEVATGRTTIRTKTGERVL